MVFFFFPLLKDRWGKSKGSSKWEKNKVGDVVGKVGRKTECEGKRWKRGGVLGCNLPPPVSWKGCPSKGQRQIHSERARLNRQLG